MQAERDTAIKAFLSDHGWGDAARAPLADDASFRRYERLRRAGQMAVLMDAPPPHEDVRSFRKIADHLRRLGYSAPEIYAADETLGLLLLEDLGDDTFTRVLARAERGGDETSLYENAVDVLIDLHRRPAGEAIPPGLAVYDDEKLMDEANLLPVWAYGDGLSDTALADYEAAWRALFPLLHGLPQTLVLRDFHVDNLLWLPDRDGVRACGLLDFQDALAGPAAYDLMSLVEDARRDLAAGLKATLLARYSAAFPDVDLTACHILAAQRHAKVIGIFTRLSLRDGKPGYLGHIPRVWRLLEKSLENPVLNSVKKWFDRHIPVEQRTIPHKKKKL